MVRETRRVKKMVTYNVVQEIKGGKLIQKKRQKTWICRPDLDGVEMNVNEETNNSNPVISQANYIFPLYCRN